MSSPDSATAGDAFSRSREDVRYYPATQFDKGARAFACCCAVVYAVLSCGLIAAVLAATLRL